VKRLIVLITTIIFLTACASIGNNQQAAYPELETQQDLAKVAWQLKANAGTTDNYLRLRTATVGNRIYSADSKGKVIAVDTTNGSVIWTSKSSVRIIAGVEANQDLVVFAANNAKLYALNASSGKKKWQTRLASETLVAPTLIDNKIIARSIDGKVYALDAETGDKIWIFDHTSPALTLRASSEVAVAEDKIIAGFPDGLVIAIDLETGKELRASQVAVGHGKSELQRMVDIVAAPKIVGSKVYIAAYQGKLAALSLASGEPLWQRDISVERDFAANSEMLVVTDSSNNVYAFDADNGATLWHQDGLNSNVLSAPAIGDKFVAVGDNSGVVHWFNPTTGALIGRNKISKSKISAAPIIIKQQVIVSTQNGELKALAIS